MRMSLVQNFINLLKQRHMKKLRSLFLAFCVFFFFSNMNHDCQVYIVCIQIERNIYCLYDFMFNKIKQPYLQKIKRFLVKQIDTIARFVREKYEWFPQIYFRNIHISRVHLHPVVYPNLVTGYSTKYTKFVRDVLTILAI